MSRWRGEWPRRKPLTPDGHGWIVLCVMYGMGMVVNYLLRMYDVLSDDTPTALAWYILLIFVSQRAADSVKRHMQWCIDAEELTKND